MKRSLESRSFVVFDRFTLADLTVPVLGAPMAGGPSTPALAAAVSNAGGLGFLAGGMSSAAGLADAIGAARRLTSGPLGVNLFVPQGMTADAEQLTVFAKTLAREAHHYGVSLEEPSVSGYDDEWDAKLDVVRELRPEVVSFTFGSPGAAVCRSMHDAGVSTVATVTTAREAVVALNCPVDALVAQGPDAGGHRATFNPLAAPPGDSLDNLVTALVACFDRPVVAAGGLGTPDDVGRLRDAGAAAVQLGTAFLLADEAGTNAVHRAALRDPAFADTAVTRAFTGRCARALRNRFLDVYDADAISGFPQVAMLTAPLQAAALKIGDPHGVAMWAGTAFRKAKTGPAADIVHYMAG
ncbi:2-nitropropane dioxygenase [Mycobacterium sp. E1747]|nr:2-nitropropane dioxygenase [Mycobacterium sp. E1747]